MQKRLAGDQLSPELSDPSPEPVEGRATDGGLVARPAYHKEQASTARPSGSAAATWAPLARFIEAEARIGAWAEQRTWTHFIYEFVRFGIKQGWACLFGALVLALLIGTHLFYPKGAWLARYDFLVLAALGIQAAMLILKMETFEEAKVIFVFHMVGTIMEVFKTSVGSWIYPEASLLRIGGVPLFTGFMYAAIGSYIARCWRLFDFRFTYHPPLWALSLLALGIYVNFYAHHYLPDMRLLLFALTIVLFGRCWVHFKIWQVHRRMPLLLGFVLVALFIWIAENVGTFTAAWMYPHQRNGWSLVSMGKLGAWFLLMIVSYTLVALLNRPQRMTSPSTFATSGVRKGRVDRRGPRLGQPVIR